MAGNRNVNDLLNAGGSDCETDDSDNYDSDVDSDRRFDYNEDSILNYADSLYQVLTPTELCTAIPDDVDQIRRLVTVPGPLLQALLFHFKWQKDVVIERYFEDAAKLYDTAHVIHPHQQALPASNDCEICFERRSASSMFTLGCKHVFCVDCWNAYLTHEIASEGRGPLITCAALGCDTLVLSSIVHRFVNDPSVISKYKKFELDTYVKCGPLFRWCPGPDCQNAFRVSHSDVRLVSCYCGTRICFQCGEAWHEPISCELLKKWLKKCSDNSETSNWILVNTKKCPKCHTSIEKSGGCNHMTCRAAQCGAEFCWKCLGLWSKHNSGSCNVYEKESKLLKSSQESLARYNHYYNRFSIHQQSLRFENKLRETVNQKMADLLECRVKPVDSQFFMQAAEALVICRQNLMFTYAFAYYLKSNNQAIIFEGNQSDLEASTERLSGYLELRISSKQECDDIRVCTLDTMRYCLSRQMALLKHIEEGYENGWWIFS